MPEPSDAVKGLVKQLQDEDVAVRRRAAESLKGLGDRSAVPALVPRVADDLWSDGYDNQAANYSSKRAALDALRVLAPDRVTQALLGALKSKNEQVRVRACEELGTQSDRDSVAGLTAARQDPSEKVRKAAAEALSKHK